METKNYKLNELNELNELIWKELQNSKNENVVDDTITVDCNNCKNEKYEIFYYENYSVCSNCGIILSENNLSSDIVYDKEQIYVKKRMNCNGKNSRILKMQNWLTWTSDEKNTYKLKNYTISLCENLGIVKDIISRICELVENVMLAIKDNCDGPKRSRVKDGIIIMCIHYISKYVGDTMYDYSDLSKKIKLETKYICKADKILMELINCNKLQLSKDFLDIILQTNKPINYVLKIIEKYKLNICQKTIDDTTLLIDICEDNDILLDNTPLSIGVSCFYYILIKNNIEIDIKIFSDIYNLSTVTVTKTFTKLDKYFTKKKCI